MKKNRKKRAAPGTAFQNINDYLPTVSDPLEMLGKLVRLGLTNKELAEFYGVSETTFRDFMARNDEIRILVEVERSRPNHLVEQALFKRAVGYHSKELTFQDGRPTKFVIKEVFPDVTAQIFYLKNRVPERWRDSIEHKHTLRDRMAMIRGAQTDPKLLHGKKDDGEIIEAEEA